LARLSEFIAQQRDKQVLDRARPHLEGDESVVVWARARHPEKRRQGYAFLTDRKLLVVWSGSGDGHGVVSWERIGCWGVDDQNAGGPLLGIEFDRDSLFVELPVTSHGAAARVTGFLRRFAYLAPRPRSDLAKAGHPRGFSARPATVEAPRRSVSGHTKRIVLTIVGIVLVIGGLAIIPIPGPWSLPIILAGLAVLASEYDWAQDILEWVREKSRRTAEKLKARRAAR
jgi:uncharacterized protein (TIGR02611 family)